MSLTQQISEKDARRANREVNVMADLMAERDLERARAHIQDLLVEADIERVRRVRHAGPSRATDALLDTVASALIAAGERLKRRRLRRIRQVHLEQSSAGAAIRSGVHVSHAHPHARGASGRAGRGRRLPASRGRSPHRV